MTKQQIKRLAELTKNYAGKVGLDAAGITEMNELNALLETESDDGISEGDLKKIVAEAVKSAMPSRHQQASSDAYEIEFPIAHRAGNLAVAQKQLLNCMLKKPMDDGIPESLLKSANERGELYEKRLQLGGYQGIIGRKVSSLTAGGANAGADLMNIGLSSVLLERLYLSSELASRMISQEIVMPTNPFNLPLTTTRPTFQAGIPELTPPAASGPGTARPVLNAEKLMGMVQYSDEADEDSLIAILPMVTNQLGLAAGQALEDAILNGDTTLTQDLAPGGGAIAANDPKSLFDGIRKLTLAQSSLKVLSSHSGLLSPAW
jgi:HK97 family phage major capsid protein